MPSLLFLSLMNSAPWGGSEELWYRTALYALDKGHSVACVVYSWPGKKDKLKTLKDKGAIIYELPNKGVAKKNWFEKIQFKISKKITLKKYVTSLPFSEYDVTIINLGEFENTHSAWIDLYKRLNCYVVLYHNYREGQTFKPGKIKALQHWMDKAKLNLFASRRIKEILEDNSGIHIHNGDIFLNPITFTAPSQPAPYPDLKDGNYIFIMLAALEVFRKAQDNLIKTLSSKKWKERNWNLYLYGDGKDMQLLKDLIKHNEIEDKIFLKGQTNDAKQVLQEAHFLVQMTNIDAMPLSVIEAMAVGRAVAVSSVGDMPFWIKEGINGWVSKNATVEDIDMTLEKAWHNRENWELMGKKGFEAFIEKFPVSVEKELLDKII